MVGILRKRTRTGLTYIGMTGLALLMLFPFYWMVMGSLMSETEVTSFPIRLVPERPRFENYTVFFLFNRLESIRQTELRADYLGPPGERGDVLIWVGNTLFITLVGLLGVIFVSGAAGYAFAKLDFWGKDTIFLAFMSAMLMPWMVMLIPRYLFFRQLGWVGTFRPLYTPYLIGGGMLVIFLFRQHFKSIPNELVDAAKIDGAGHLRIFLQIMLPLSKAQIATVSILFTMERWNDLIEPLLYLSDSRSWTLSLAMFNIVRKASTAAVGSIPINLQMAGAVILTLPVILLFLLTQRYFIQGLTQGGFK